MTRAVAASVLCAALGAAYSWQLSVDTRWRESACRVANVEAAATLETCGDKLAEARAIVALCEGVARIWHERAAGYQRAYLRSMK
jgi:hypothetical protein